MITDFSNFDKNTIRSLNAIENKAHVRYIRYLLTKRVPPTSIGKELARLALSSPSKYTLEVYFTNVIWPLIEEYDLEKYYKQYYKRLVNSKSKVRIPPVLNFDVSFGENEGDRISFCKFIRDLEVEEMWSNEVTRYYGGVQNIPQDDEGNRIIKANVTRSVENILTCPRKYVIDKLLLENVPITRIPEYMWDKYKVKVNESDLYAYSKYFFNFERRGIEEIIERLIAEQNSIKNDLEVLNKNDNYSLGDKLAISKQYQERIAFLEESIREMNARYSDVTYKQGIEERLEIHEIVEDIVQRGYNRLKRLDRSNDRDVVRPLTDVAKMVFSAIDKLHQCEESKLKIKEKKAALADRDKSVQEVLVEAYQERYDEHIKQAEEKLGEDIDKIQIEGIEEV